MFKTYSADKAHWLKFNGTITESPRTYWLKFKGTMTESPRTDWLKFKGTMTESPVQIGSRLRAP